MGHQSRLKRTRREERSGVVRTEAPLRILRSIHRTIQGHCSESGRRCWEYLLEMCAQVSGWETDSCEAKHLWDKMDDEPRWTEFLQSWHHEVESARANRGTFSEPFGELLEEISGTNSALGQFFTPMPVVRMMNELTIEHVPPYPDGMPSRRALDPTCGTGRFMIDALVHDDGVLVHAVDTDLWMLRCAMLNVRLLAKWTSLRVNHPDDRMAPLGRPRNLFDRMMEQAKPITPRPVMRQLENLDGEAQASGNTILIGGRSVFMHADALVVDLNYIPNWTCAGWHWGPRPWRGNLKIDGYLGTYDEWVAAGRPRLGDPPTNEIQFDYSMRQTA